MKEKICSDCGKVESNCLCGQRRIEKEVTRIIENSRKPESIIKAYKYVMENMSDDN